MSEAGSDGGAKLSVVEIAGKSHGYAMARSEAEPTVRHVVAQRNASAALFQGSGCDMNDRMEAMNDIAAEIAGGDITVVSKMLMTQAVSLDAMMTQMMLRGQANMAEYPDAHERFMRLALKAQSQSRATLEALAKIHQPREQTVRHIHVGPDGQAVFIENLHGD